MTHFQAVAITHDSGAISWTQITTHLTITYTIGADIINDHVGVIANETN